MKRQVYEEKALTLDTLNPYIELPKMTLEEVNGLNKIIKRNTELAVIDDGDGRWYRCPTCNRLAGKYEDIETRWCRYCGQRLNGRDIAI